MLYFLQTFHFADMNTLNRFSLTTISARRANVRRLRLSYTLSFEDRPAGEVADEVRRMIEDSSSFPALKDFRIYLLIPPDVRRVTAQQQKRQIEEVLVSFPDTTHLSSFIVRAPWDGTTPPVVPYQLEIYPI
jgi:hypothetical protein